ncbi:MAG: sigma-70 family RNA polymerase sigma factor [Chitinophagales bacterium]
MSRVPAGAARDAAPHHPGEAEVVELIGRARQGDGSAREELIGRNLRLVRSVAGRFRRTAVEEEDLFQLGCLGLVKAVDRFDPSRGVAFSTYAVPYIAGEILSFLRNDRPVKIGRGALTQARETLRARDQLAQELGREPTIGEVAVRLGTSEEDVVESLDALQAPLSLEAPLGDSEGQGLHRGDTVAASAEDPDPVERLALVQGLARLPEMERRLLELRFFAQLTQVAVGQALGISQVQVSRVEKRALTRLRRSLLA